MQSLFQQLCLYSSRSFLLPISPNVSNPLNLNSNFSFSRSILSTILTYFRSSIYLFDSYLLSACFYWINCARNKDHYRKLDSIHPWIRFHTRVFASCFPFLRQIQVPLYLPLLLTWLLSYLCIGSFFDGVDHSCLVHFWLLQHKELSCLMNIYIDVHKWLILSCVIQLIGEGQRKKSEVF